MSIDTEALKQRVDIVSVVGSYVTLKKRGTEYVGLCPFHSDSNPSLRVVPAKGFCHCFACDAHHDVISFVQAMDGLDFKAACERLGAKDEWTPRTPITHEAAADPKPERITSKPPPDTPSPDMAIKSLGGEPSRIFPIKDLDGSPIAYECRYEQAEGKKEIRIWSWGAKGDRAPSWGVGHINAPRPLYGLERIGAHPGAAVLITEGPKKADAGRELLPSYASVSWTGGANAWHKHDYSPLKGKQVLIIPDNDAPGITAAEKLAALLVDPRGLACRVRLVDPNRMPDGWDIADWKGTTQELIDWAKPRAKDILAPAPSAPPAQEKPPERKRPKLAVVDGNVALAPEAEIAPAPASMSEDFMADHFANTHGDKWRYVKQWGAWFQWRGDGWYEDRTAFIDRLAVEVTRQALYWPEAAALTTADARRKVNSRRTAGAVRDLAMSDRRIAATTEQWDTDPWLLGVPGGVVDLRNGQFEQATQTQYITKRTLIAPQAGEAPIWTRFLNTVTDENAKVISFLQRFAGYCLTGETREQCLAFLYGTGQNGKGVFITTISRVLGDYALSADADVFMESDAQRHSTEMARLRGARLVYVDETDSSKRWNEKRIKRITGGGRIEARFMRQDDFEFTPQFKLLVAGNHKPQLRGVGKAIQRRIHLVPFTVTIRDSERDDELPQKLEAEYPQILQWMIEGCAQWRAAGLQAPAEVLDATNRYIESEDVIGEWLEERTLQTGEIARPVAYKNYRAWMDARGERPWSTKAFSAALEERGYVDRKSNGQVIIAGLSLRAYDSAPNYPQYTND